MGRAEKKELPKGTGNGTPNFITLLFIVYLKKVPIEHFENKSVAVQKTQAFYITFYWNFFME